MPIPFPYLAMLITYYIFMSVPNPDSHISKTFPHSQFDCLSWSVVYITINMFSIATSCPQPFPYCFAFSSRFTGVSVNLHLPFFKHFLLRGWSYKPSSWFSYCMSWVVIYVATVAGPRCDMAEILLMWRLAFIRSFHRWILLKFSLHCMLMQDELCHSFTPVRNLQPVLLTWSVQPRRPLLSVNSLTHQRSFQLFNHISYPVIRCLQA